VVICESIDLILRALVGVFRLASIGKLLVEMASSLVVQTTEQHSTTHRTYRYAFSLLHSLDVSITRIAHVYDSKQHDSLLRLGFAWRLAVIRLFVVYSMAVLWRSYKAWMQPLSKPCERSNGRLQGSPSEVISVFHPQQ
jgi:hypothetical protein